MGYGMEDYIVVDIKIVKGYKFGLYVIFDGYLGCNVVDYL